MTALIPKLKDLGKSDCCTCIYSGERKMRFQLLQLSMDEKGVDKITTGEGSMKGQAVSIDQPF